MLAPGPGLASVNAADLASRHPKSPEGQHLPPGVVAVARKGMESLFRLTLNCQVTVYGEDLAIDLVGE